MNEKNDLMEISRKLTGLIAGLDIDITGVVNLGDVPGSRLEEAARRLLPEAKSVVVFAMEVYPEVLSHSRPGRTAGTASLNDLLERHLDYLGSRLNKAVYDVAKASRQWGRKALPLPAVGCPMDARFLEAVFSYKHAAVVAGMGYLGKSSLLLTPEFGPRVRLACCLTGVPLQTTAKQVSEMCPGCDICVENCPSGALSQPVGDAVYTINKFACSSFRGASTGCSECLRLCPAGH